MKKRAFIIHGWSGHPDEHWLPWLKEELEQKGFEVHVPLMSRNDDPVIEEWDARLAEVVGSSDENTYFIGHSIGCQAIMRYLATRDEKAGGCVFVAGWFWLDNMENAHEEKIAEPWINQPIDFGKVMAATNNISVFISDTDDFGKVEENTKAFQENLHAKVKVLHDMGHFTTGDGVTEVPMVLEAVLEQAKG